MNTATNNTAVADNANTVNYVKGVGRTTRPGKHVLVEGYLDRSTENGGVKTYIQTTVFIERGQGQENTPVRTVFWGEAAEAVKADLMVNNRVLKLNILNGRLESNVYEGKRRYSLHINYTRQFEVIENREHSSARRPNIGDIIPAQIEQDDPEAGVFTAPF